MKVKANFIYLIIIAFLIALLIIGHQINKKSSASKKNEISNIVNQLKTRNNQLAKIQKNLFEDGKNLNDIINKKEITFENIFKDKKLDGLNNFSYSKYSTKDILFNGNRGATGTAYIDFYNNDKNLLIATYDGIFAFTNLNNLENFVKRGIKMFDKLGVKILGLVDNMSYFIGDDNKKYKIFGEGGVRKTSEEFNKEFLGEIPINSEIGKTSDNGKPIVEEDPNCEISKIYINFANKIKSTYHLN